MKKPEKKVKVAKPLKKRLGTEMVMEAEMVEAKVIESKPLPKHPPAIEKLLGDTAEQFNELELVFKDLEEGAARTRFQQGVLVRPLFRKGHGENLVDELATRVHCHPSLLYKWHKVAKELKYDINIFDEKVKVLNEAGKRATTRYFLGFIPKEDKEARGGEENHKEELLTDIEKGINAAQVAQEVYGQDPEVQGAVGTLIEDGREGIDLLSTANHAPIRKEKAWKCPPLLMFTRLQESLVPGEGAIDPEHTISKGRAGNNADDLFVVPLARDIHIEKTKNGYEAIEEKYGVDFREGIRKNVTSFIDFLLGACNEGGIDLESLMQVKYGKDV